MKKNIKTNQLELKLDPKIYPLGAVYATCYVFIDKAYLFLDGNPKKEIKVFIKGKKNFSKKQLESLSGEFLNELLSNTLRMTIDKQNKKIRQYVVEQALFSAVYASEESPEVSLEKIEKQFEEDPLGIAIPWDEKHEDKKIKSVKKSVKKERKND